MTVQLKTYKEDDKTYVATGFSKDNGFHRAHDQRQYTAERAGGEVLNTDSYDDALAFIAAGLGKPERLYTL